MTKNKAGNEVEFYTVRLGEAPLRRWLLRKKTWMNKGASHICSSGKSILARGNCPGGDPKQGSWPGILNEQQFSFGAEYTRDQRDSREEKEKGLADYWQESIIYWVTREASVVFSAGVRCNLSYSSTKPLSHWIVTISTPDCGFLGTETSWSSHLYSWHSAQVCHRVDV